MTARAMLLFYDGLTIYCFTNLHSKKYKQLTTNPNVALAVGKLQIEGVATLKGHPLDDENARFIELHQEQNPEFYKKSTSVHFPQPTLRVIEITPKRIAKWVCGNQIDILNISRGEAHRVEYYEIEESPA